MPSFVAFKEGSKLGDVIGARPAELTVCIPLHSIAATPRLTNTVFDHQALIQAHAVTATP